jgi:hypothetical protein
MNLSPQRRMPRRIALGVVLVVLSVFLAATAATASPSSATPDTSGSTATSLSALADVSLAPSRTATLAPAVQVASMTAPTYRRTAPALRVHRAARTITQRSYAYATTARRTTVLRRATNGRTTTGTRSSASELSRARAILAQYIAKYPICKGATVYMGKTPGGSEGCVYLGSGTIVVNPNHTSSLSYIIGHEINHLRQYRESH